MASSMSSFCAANSVAHRLARQWYGHTAGILLFWTRLGAPFGLAAAWLGGTGGAGALLPFSIGPLAAGCYAAGYILLRAGGPLPLRWLKLVDSLLLAAAFGGASWVAGLGATPSMRSWLWLPAVGLWVLAWLANWRHEGRPEGPGEGGLPGAPPFAVAPVDGPISAGYRSYDRSHTGVDFAVPVGTPVWAPSRGQAVQAGPLGQWGYAVEIDHGGGWSTFYAHLERPLVRAGTPLQAGDLIGFSGTSGISTGPHVHVELRYQGVPVDPAVLIGA
ncbi:MAG TPA: M23 family metallopeptidase [Symbiobacteriaceae bacterium]|nr:M23 family metallopeptidase [Symbiobacteriaceae bacterium]